MNRSTFLRISAAAATLAGAPLAWAQTPPRAAGIPEHWGFIVAISGVGVLFVLGIIAIALFAENRRNGAKLALVEKLVMSGQAVPRELMTNLPAQLPLPEERRRDVRRGITLLSLGAAVALIPIIGSGGEWRYGVWGLLFLLPALGSFLKAHLTAREIARCASTGSPRT